MGVYTFPIFLAATGIRIHGDDEAANDATDRDKRGITSLDRYDIMNSPVPSNHLSTILLLVVSCLVKISFSRFEGLLT